MRFGRGNSRSGLSGDALALLAGAVLPLAFAPFGYALLAILCTGTLFALWESPEPARAARRGFLFGVGAFLAGTYWLYISMHTFGKAPLAVAIPLMLGLVAIMAGYLALLGWLVTRTRVAGSWRWFVLLPALWTLTEWLRGWLASGFPWLALGYSQSDTALAGLVPVLGVYGASWAVAVSAGALLALMRGTTRVRVTAVVALLGVWGGAAILEGRQWTEPRGAPLPVSVVQGAVSQDRKWLPEQLVPTMELYRELTEEHWDSRIIVWPESAIPALLHEIADYLDALFVTAAENGSAIVMGVIQYDFDAQRYYNTVIGFDEGALSVYYKRHLVPFGEYFPVPDFVRRWMRLMSLPSIDYTSGPREQAPLPVAGELIGTSICYEDVFGEELITQLPAATLLVNVSNDAWFGGSIAPHQHLQITRLRALEAGRYLIRSTNTGISAVIAPDGAVEQRLPQFESGVMRATVQPFVGATPYARYANWPLVSACVLLALLALTRRWRSISR